MSGMVRVAIIDDHLLFRQGLATLLGAVREIRVVTHAGLAREVLASEESTAIDVLLLDVETDGPPARQVIPSIRRTHPGIAVVVLTMHRDAILRRSLLRAGASDYVTKDSSVPALVDAIRHAHVHRSTAAIASAPMLLTSREVEVLRLIAHARSNADIAVELRLAVGTVKRHVHNLFRKLDASSRLEAIARARLLGVLDDPAGDVSS